MVRNLSVGIRNDVKEIEYILNDNSSKYIRDIFVSMPNEILNNTGRKGIGISTFEDIEKIVKIAHERNVQVTCVGNQLFLGKDEFNPKYLKKVCDGIKRLDEIGVDSVTLANGTLIDRVGKMRKNKLIKMGLNVSTYQVVTSTGDVLEYYNMGVSRVILHQKINFEFDLLKRISKVVKERCPDLELELYINSKCVSCGSCPMNLSHASYKSISKDDFNIEEHEIAMKKDPLLMWCKSRRKNDIMDELLIPSIRPEDLYLYYEYGFTTFKLATRTATKEEVIDIISAYGNRDYNGYFSELWSNLNGVHLIPNKALQGLLEFFKKNNIYPENMREYYEKIGELYYKVKDLSNDEQIQKYQNLIKRFK